MRNRAGIVILLFMLLCLIWSLVIPIGESHDECNHVRYAQFLWENLRLPEGREIWSGQVTEGFQPPLYHIIVAGFIGLIGFSIDEINWVSNPRFATVSTGEPNVFDNRTIRDSSPSRAITKFHLLRLPSIAIAGLTFWWLWLGLARLFANEALALTAVSVWAFMVQTTHMGGVVGNDMLTACLCALAFVHLVEARSKPDNRRYVVIAILLGLAIMTKMTGLFVYGGVGLGLLLNGTWKRRPFAFLSVVVLPLLIGGWAVLRSMQVHIPPTEKAWIATLADGIVPYAKSWIIAIFHAVQSGIFLFIGQPGWGWLPMPPWYYGMYLALPIVVVFSIGRGFQIFSRTLPIEVAAYFIGLIVFFGMTVYWFRESSERLAGRFFYPFMAGPLGILCWWLEARRDEIQPKRLLAATLGVAGIALVAAGSKGSRSITMLGSLLKSSGPFQMASEHYSTLIATDLMIAGYTFLILGIGLFIAHRYRVHVEKMYGPVVAVSTVMNVLLLVFWVKPNYT
jgi:4-amino-4-deoxy-L-arabinose transferase-like glycosyltransferase